ncbi:hypothetical protein CPB85DRAFT_1319120 [Mucidula mucida]|nr:hypothetical protein CPB85DRAFT_1319120 [Mucidula mucida]
MFPSWDFLVVPHAVRKLYTKDRSIYFIALLVMNQDKPVLLLEMMDDSYITKGSTRGRADTQMRILFNDLYHEQCRVPILYGISALGMTLRVYQADTATFMVHPRADPSVWETLLPPHYLENEWSVELLSQEGFDEMKRIGTYIISESAKAP